jgi:subtilisin family serine protease
MKKLLFLLLISSQVLFAQDRDPRTDQFNFVPGQLIVQLKEHIDAEITYKSSGVGTTQKDIGTLLGIGDKVSKAKVLFSEKTVLKSISMKNALVKDPRLPEPHSLKNTFVIELNDKQENILALVEELKGNPDVEYAEPNYYYSVNDFTIDSEIITEDELNEPSTKRTAADPNDALYSQQLNIPATNIDKVWNTYTTGDGSQTIAILDTGIDYEHPDLVDNIWINQAELNGIEGFDDDNNGYIDDIKGWDFINLDNAPLDDNMHGTHVAGIAGAVGDNAIGIAGAAWNVKLIPIKVFQASGIGDLATIAQGIDYAVNNEATVLNMSFGGVASITLKNALANAYATSFLVAAAGNNGMPLPPCIPSLIFYPAAYTFVLGVESNGGFSNYDCDGPIFSTLIEQQNYETKALGVSILSTVPNGGYRNLSGTSMAAPLVSGFMALYKQIKQEDSNERIFGNIINTKTGEYIDALAAIVAEPSPILKILTAQAIDTISGNVYQDGQLDSGEEIHLYPKIKNYWGQADSVKVVLKLGGNEVQNEFYRSIITLTDSIIDIGSISDYAIYNQYENPLKFKISNDVAHNTQIEFRMIAWDEIQENTKKDSLVFKLKIKNAVKLQGLIEKDTILYPDTEYILTNPLILNNASLILKPGVTLRFGADELTQQSGRITFLNQSNIVALGTKDSLITFKPDTYSSGFRIDFGNGYSYLDYCVIDNGQFVYPGETTNSQFINGGGQYGGIMKKSNMIQPTYVMYGSWEHVNIVDANANNQQTNGLRYYTPLKNNVLGMYAAQYDYIGNYYSYDLTGYYLGSNYITEFENIYLGTGSVDILKELNTDAFDGGTGVFKYNNPRLVPYSEAHGIVWKVEVNGLNALDEYDQMDPIGVGNHEFKVYFNRAADTFYTPNIAYGVREPWNSKMITEIGSWSEDSTIYSVIHDVKIGAADGINRIRVTDARDVEGFEVPVEQRRFNILIQSAGSASAGFMATPGLGEITLEWEAPDETLLEDVLGYNMYRYDAITDSTFTDTIKLNTVLISDAQFIDYQVEEGKRYYYQYKILRTSFDETDFSKTVEA